MSRSRKGPSSFPTEAKSPSLADELVELRTATKLAHEVLRDLKEERKGLQQEKADIERVKSQVESSIAEAKEFIDREIVLSIAASLGKHIMGGQKIIDENIEEFKGLMEEFRDARDVTLSGTLEILERKVEVLRKMDKTRTARASQEKLANDRVEIYVVTPEDLYDVKSTPSTFGNGG